MTKFGAFTLTILYLVSVSDAFGFSCGEQTLDERIDRVNTIVFAVLMEAHIQDASFPSVSATFRTHEVLKGTEYDIFHVSTAADFGTGSGIALTIGMHYLLFFDSTARVVHACSGSGRAGVDRVELVKQKL